MDLCGRFERKCIQLLDNKLGFMNLTQEQENELRVYLEEFQKSSTVPDNGVDIEFASFDDKRVEAIAEIKDIVNEFLKGALSSTEFKEKSDLMSRKYPYWGFSGFSGQMQLNQFVKNIEDSEKDNHLKEIIPRGMRRECTLCFCKKLSKMVMK